MDWKRFADEMPEGKDGSDIAVWSAKFGLEYLTFDAPTSEWRYVDDGCKAYPNENYWTHWLLIEPPAEEESGDA